MVKNLLITFIVLLIMFLIIEAAGRIFSGLLPDRIGQDFVSCSNLQSRLKLHKTFGRVEHAKHKYFNRRSQKDPWFSVEINALGFRDTINSGSERVIVLGDSFTFGVHAPQGQTYPDFLDKMFPDFAFHNFALDGAGTAQEYLIYKNIANNLPHRLVILTMFDNDIENNLHKGRYDEPWRPKFELKNGNLEFFPPISNSSNSPDASNNRNFFEEFTWYVTKNTWYVLKKSFVVNALYYRVGLSLNTIFLPNTSDEMTRKGINLTMNIIKALHVQVLEYGASLFIVTIPKWQENGGIPFVESNITLLNDLKELERTLHNFHIYDAAKELKENPSEYYGKVDKHLTPKGYYVLAKAVGNFLGSTSILPTMPIKISFEEIAVAPNCANFDQYVY